MSMMVNSHSVPTGSPLFGGHWVLQEVEAGYGSTFPKKHTHQQILNLILGAYWALKSIHRFSVAEISTSRGVTLAASKQPILLLRSSKEGKNFELQFTSLSLPSFSGPLSALQRAACSLLHDHSSVSIWRQLLCSALAFSRLNVSILSVVIHFSWDPVPLSACYFPLTVR